MAATNDPCDFSRHERWVSAGEAHQLLSDCFVGSEIAKSEIADRLRRGRLTARARELFRIDGERWRWNPPEKVGLIASAWLDPAIWRTSRRWTDDQRHWRMCFSQMLLTTRLKPERRLILHGVRFLRAEIEAIAAQAPSRRSLVRQAASDRYFAIHKAVLDTLRSAKRYGLRETSFGSRRVLIHHVRALFGVDPRTGEYRQSEEAIADYVALFLGEQEAEGTLPRAPSRSQKLANVISKIERTNALIMRQFRTFRGDPQDYLF